MKPINLFYGEETFLIDREIRKIETECGVSGAGDLNREVFDAKETPANNIMMSAKTLPFMGGTKFLLVKNVNQWKVEDWDVIVEYAKKPNPSTSLNLVATDVDKRRTWWKAIQKSVHIEEFKKPADNTLPGFIKGMADEARIKLDGGAVRSLVLKIGPELGLLWSAILKLQAYAGPKGTITEADVDELISASRMSSIFILQDSIGEKNLQKSLTVLKNLLEHGEPPIKILLMISKHVRALFKAWEIGDSGKRLSDKESAERIGIPPFKVTQILKQARGWDRDDLEIAMMKTLKTDIGLKSGGGQELLEALVMDLCR